MTMDSSSTKCSGFSSPEKPRVRRMLNKNKVIVETCIAISPPVVAFTSQQHYKCDALRSLCVVNVEGCVFLIQFRCKISSIFTSNVVLVNVISVSNFHRLLPAVCFGMGPVLVVGAGSRKCFTIDL